MAPSCQQLEPPGIPARFSQLMINGLIQSASMTPDNDRPSLLGGICSPQSSVSYVLNPRERLHALRKTERRNGKECDLLKFLWGDAVSQATARVGVHCTLGQGSDSQ